MIALAIDRYSSRKEAEDAFRAGKDFLVGDVVGKHGRWNGKRFSIRDLDEGEFVEIRYGRNHTNVTGIKI